MPTTPVYDLPYPGPGDPDNVPVDIFALAGRLEEILDDIQASKLTSGTYTPTLTGVLNVDTTTAYPWMWVRVGDIVTVDGSIQIDSTATGETAVRASLPVASDLAVFSDLAGSLAGVLAGSLGGQVVAHPSTNQAQMDFLASSTIGNILGIHFAYKVI